MNNASFLSHSSYDLYSTTLTGFIASLWTCLACSELHKTECSIRGTVTLFLSSLILPPKRTEEFPRGKAQPCKHHEPSYPHGTQTSIHSILSELPHIHHVQHKSKRKATFRPAQRSSQHKSLKSNKLWIENRWGEKGKDCMPEVAPHYTDGFRLLSCREQLKGASFQEAQQWNHCNRNQRAWTCMNRKRSLTQAIGYTENVNKQIFLCTSVIIHIFVFCIYILWFSSCTFCFLTPSN